MMMVASVSRVLLVGRSENGWLVDDGATPCATRQKLPGQQKIHYEVFCFFLKHVSSAFSCLKTRIKSRLRTTNPLNNTMFIHRHRSFYLEEWPRTGILDGLWPLSGIPFFLHLKLAKGAIPLAKPRRHLVLASFPPGIPGFGYFPP